MKTRKSKNMFARADLRLNSPCDGLATCPKVCFVPHPMCDITLLELQTPEDERIGNEQRLKTEQRSLRPPSSK